MRPLDQRALRLGLLVHGSVVLAAATPLARESSPLDALGLLLLAASTVGYVSGRVASAEVDGAHTAFVAGTLGGLLAAGTFTVGVLTDTASGAFFRLHLGLATAGIPSWLVIDYGTLVVVGGGLALWLSYALAALAGGAIAVGDVLRIESPGGPRTR